MSKQKLNQTMSLDSIENIEQINDLAAETISAGFSFQVAAAFDGQPQGVQTVTTNTARIDIDRSDNYDEIEIQVFNNSHSWDYFDISLHDANTGHRYAHIHRSYFGADGKSWSEPTIAHDEIDQYNLYNKDLYLYFVKK